MGLCPQAMKAAVDHDVDLGECQMNLPGDPSGYWECRLSWEQVGRLHAQRLCEVTAAHGRCPIEKLRLPPRG